MTPSRPTWVLVKTTTHLRPCTSYRAAYRATVSVRRTDHDRYHPQQRRAFVTNPFATNQTLTATRTLQFPISTIYSVISDVGSYSHFVPYCQRSIVTKTSQPAPDGKRYPEEATLTIGFNDDIGSEFTSRVYCVPERVVEAVSGRSEASVREDEVRHHTVRTPVDQDPSRKDTVMAHLRTRWTLRPLASQEATEVDLAIEFQFTNPLYSALSSAAAPKVADRMIEAFQNRIQAVVEGSGRVKTTAGKQ